MQQLKPVNVVIAGGGFVGLTLAKEITARTSLSVVVVSQQVFHCEKMDMAPRVTCDHRMTIRCDGAVAQRGIGDESGDGLPIVCVPDNQKAIIARRDEMAAVGKGRHCPDAVRVPFQD